MSESLPHSTSDQALPFPQLSGFLAERSPQPMVAVEGLTHLVRYVNPAFLKLLGIEDQHLLGRRFEEAVPEGLANTCAAMLDRVFATGTSESLVEQEHGPDVWANGTLAAKGRTHWSYLAWAIVGPDGKPAGVMIQVTDTTEAARFRKVSAAVNEALLVSGMHQHEMKDEALALNALLRQSEERLRTLADAMRQLAWIASADGATNWYNKRWYEYTGATPQELDGWQWQRYHDPEVLPRVMEKWKASIATGEPFEMIYPLRGKDGTYRAFLTRVEPQKDAQGNPTQWFGTSTDIDEVKRAEEALRESQHFIHSVLYNLFAFVGVMTVDGTLIDANRSSVEAAGVPASEVIGRKFWDCYWWSYAPEIQAQLQAACQRAAGGEVVRYDVPVRMAGDTRVWIDFQVSPLHDTKGHITHLIPSALEITVRHAAEEKLRESEQRFRIMADGLPLMIWVHNAQGEVQFANRAYREFFGVTPEQIASPSWYPLVHPDDVAAYASEMSACVRDRLPFHAEVRVRRFDGQWRYIESRARPRFSDAGEFLGMVGSSPDITERRLAEQALRDSETHEREARAEAEAANASKDTFLATLSHELRTPLNCILGWAVLLRKSQPADGRPLSADIESGLAIIERNARAQAKLIEDVLDVARITAGKFLLHSGPLDLTGLMRAAVEALRPAAEGKGLTLEFAPGCGGGGAVGEEATGRDRVWVVADSVRLGQAVSNLLTNALKFTPRGGRISVCVESVAGKDGDLARVTVTDTGRGMEASFIPNAFERFKQAEEGAARSYGGLGLGLSVVWHIMQAHGGTARAESAGKGQGSTFTLELPVSAQAGPPRDAGQPVVAGKAARLDGVRVLVVDDEEDSRLMAKRVLEEAGATVILAASAEEGYQLAINGQGRVGAEGLQAVVSDIGMPGEDGYSMMRRLRTGSGGTHLPALAMTAFASPEDKRQALLAGFQSHMPKPIDPHELIAVVAELVGGAARPGL